MTEKKRIVLFESADGAVSLPVQVDMAANDVWLTRQHMAELFGRDVKTIGKHVNNALLEELAETGSPVVAKFATTASDGKTYQVEHYSLDMILSVGYRVKSQRGVEFRRWATDVLRRYIIDGHAENEMRLEQLGQVARIMARIPDSLETRQVLDIVQSYTTALDLLYFVVKNHSFLDGNKRIAATMFLYFLDRNGALFDNGRKTIADSTLVAITIMIAESKPAEKDAMVALVMNFLATGQ